MAEVRKVPEITVFFWIIKLLTTAMGEAVSDYLVFHFNPYVAVIAGFVVFACSLALQFWVKKYIPWIYWLAAGMVAVFGTMAADVVHIVLGVPYLTSSIFFLLMLTVTFGIWYWVERTLSIHSIYTPRREVFYWATVIVTFALGTAVGDLTAVVFRFGYFESGIVFILMMLIPFAGYFVFHMHEVVAFWFAYVLTRPLGASFADWFGKSTSAGGLGVGSGTVSLILIFLIILSILYISVSKKEMKEERG